MSVNTSSSEATSKSNMKCPVCAVALVMSERQNIEIDYCPECRGVWLDRGELDKIIERSIPQQAEAPDAGGRDYRDDSGDRGGKHGGGHHDRGYRRKSWLHEIFD